LFVFLKLKFKIFEMSKAMAVGSGCTMNINSNHVEGGVYVTRFVVIITCFVINLFFFAFVFCFLFFFYLFSVFFCFVLFTKGRVLKP